MAAAALLRSMARKLARAPPAPAPRPLLAGGARSGPGGSLPPPTSNQILQWSGDRLVAGMPAAAGLRSGAALPSLATKVARAPSQPHILNRRLHSGSSTPPPTTDKDKIIEELRRDLRHARATATFSGLFLLGVAIFGHFWITPRFNEMRDKSLAFDRIERELRDIVTRAIADEDDRPSVALAQIMQTDGHLKQQRNGTTEKGTRPDKLEDMLKEAEAGREKVQAALKEFRAATARMSKSAPSDRTEGRV